MPEGNEQFAPKGENEIRQEVVEEYAFDAESDDDKPRIDKLTKERLEAQDKLSTAIKQKKTRREEAERHAAKLKELGYDPETGKKLDDKEEDKSKVKPDDELRKKLDETSSELDKIRMEQLGDLSEDIQKNIREYAMLNKVSYREALKSDFIKFQVEQEERRNENDKAALGASGGGSASGSRKLDAIKPNDLRNLSDEDYAKWKEKNGIK